MFYIILDPNTKNPAILSDDNGNFVSFAEFKNAVEEANNCYYEKLCVTYMIVKEFATTLL